MKKILSICLTLSMLFSLSFTVEAAVDRVKFTNAVVTPTSVSVDAEYTGSGSQMVYLIAMYVNEYGKITDIKEDHKEISTFDTLSVTTLNDMSATSEIRYFLWDQLNGRTPLENVAPASPEFVETTDVGYNSISLSWDAADDDYQDVDSYNIYNGGELIANTPSTYYTDSNIGRDSINDYTVKAVDIDGLESDLGYDIEVTALPSYTAYASGDENNNTGLIHINRAGRSLYSNSEDIVFEGVPCAVTTSQARSDGALVNSRISFKFSEAAMAEIQGITSYTLELTYYDSGVGTIYLEWKGPGVNGSLGGSGKSATVATGDTGRWVTKRIAITSAGFDTPSNSSGNSYAALRIYPSRNPDAFKIYKLTIIPTASYKEADAELKAPKDKAYYGDTAIAIPDMAYTNHNAKFKMPEGAVIADDGTDKVFSVTANTLMAIDAADDYIAPTDPNVTVEVTYKAKSDATLTLTYNAAGNGEAVTTKQIKAADTWKKASFKLTDAEFSNLLMGTTLTDGADFAVSADADITIKGIRAYKPQ